MTALRDLVRDRGIRVRIARRGVDTSDKLGRHCWVIERTIAPAHPLPPPRHPL